jgi:hypothetical protein
VVVEGVGDGFSRTLFEAFTATHAARWLVRLGLVQPRPRDAGLRRRRGRYRRERRRARSSASDHGAGTDHHRPSTGAAAAPETGSGTTPAPTAEPHSITIAGAESFFCSYLADLGAGAEAEAASSG